MTASNPYSTSHDNTHMYSFVDFRSAEPNSSANGAYRRPHNNPKLCAKKNTVFEFIFTHPQLTKFATILRKANMMNAYTNSSLNITMFVPLDKYLPESVEFYDSIDRGAALRILAVSSLNNQIDGTLIRSSPVSNYITRDPYNRNILYTTNINRITELNGCIQVVEFDHKLDNGIVHFTNGLLTPTDESFIN